MHRDVMSVHALQHGRQRHVRKLAPHSREYEFAAADGGHLIEDSYCPIVQWYAVRLAGFHATIRDRPHLGGQVNFIPTPARGLAGPGGRQDEKFEAPCCNALPLAKLLHEARKLTVEHCRMMLR